MREEPFKESEGQVKAEIARWTSEKNAFNQDRTKYQQSAKVGTNLVLPRDRMLRWNRLYRAIDACQPRELGPPSGDFRRRNEIFITSITSQRRELAQWYTEATAPPSENGAGPAGGHGAAAQGLGAGPGPGGAGPGGAGPGGAVPGGAKLPGGGASSAATSGTPRADGPKGTGIVIRLTGYHFHNLESGELRRGADGQFEDLTVHQGAGFLREAFLKNLEKDRMPMLGIDGRPVLDQQQEPVTVSVKELGIAFPTITSHHEPEWQARMSHPLYDPDLEETGKSDSKMKKAEPKKPEAKKADAKSTYMVVRYPFVVEFAWYDEPPPAAPGTAVASASVAPVAVPPVTPASTTNNRVATQQ